MFSDQNRPTVPEGRHQKEKPEIFDTILEKVPGIRPEIAQLHRLYLVTETKNGIVIYDQHAAHERVLYEYFLREYEKTSTHKKIQSLLVPIPLQLPQDEFELLKEYQSTFHELGFDLGLESKDAIAINSIPSLTQRSTVEKLFQDIVTDLKNDNHTDEQLNENKKAISYLACRSAVKAGDYLNEDQRRDIVEKLDKATVKYTCPHGRPAKLRFTNNQLEKMFLRR